MIVKQYGYHLAVVAVTVVSCARLNFPVLLVQAFINLELRLVFLLHLHHLKLTHSFHFHRFDLFAGISAISVRVKSKFHFVSLKIH